MACNPAIGDNVRSGFLVKTCRQPAHVCANTDNETVDASLLCAKSVMDSNETHGGGLRPTQRKAPACWHGQWPSGTGIFLGSVAVVHINKLQFNANESKHPVKGKKKKEGKGKKDRRMQVIIISNIHHHQTKLGGMDSGWQSTSKPAEDEVLN